MSVDRRILPLVAGALALAGFAVSLGAGGPERLRFAAVAGGLFFSTGYALLRALRTRAGKEERWTAALAFPLSAAILFAPLFVGQLTGAGTAYLLLLARPLLLLSGAFLFFDGIRGRTGGGGLPGAVAAAAVLAAALALARGGLVTVVSDAPDHIAVIREIQATGDCFPLGAYYGEPTDRLLDARKGFHYPAAAVAGALARVDARTVFDGLAGPSAAFFAIAFWTLAREALGAGAAAPLALAFALLTWDGGLLGVWFGRAPSGFGFAAPAVWSALALLLRASRRGEPVPRAALILHGIALMGIHVFSAITALFLGGFYLVALPWARRGTRPSGKGVLLGLAALLAGAAPLGVWRYLTGFPALDPIHTHLQAVVWVGKGLYFSSPFRTFSRVGLFSLAAIPLAFLLLRRARRERGVLFALAITLLPPFVALNPLLVPLLAPFVGYLVGRLAWFGGYALVLGVLVAGWGRAALQPGRWSARVPAGTAALLLFLLLLGTLRSADANSPQQRLRFRPVHNGDREKPEEWADLFTWMEENLPARAVVAADPVTGYLIPAFTPQKALAVKAQHSSPGDPTAPERLRDAIRATSPYFGSAETARALDRWDADYVLLNYRYPALRTTYLGAVDPFHYEPALEKFRREPDRYEDLFSRDRCHLFRIDRNASLSDAGPVLDPRLPGPPASARPVDVLFPNGVRLVAVSVDRTRTAPGDSLRVACYWRKEEEHPDPIPYKVFLRLDRRPEEGEEEKFKAGRIWNQLRTGEHDRARVMRNPGGGAYPVFAWSPGEIVADTIRARVPGNMREGRYELQVRLRRSPFIQVHMVGDLFRERDSFSGVPVGELTLDRSARRAAAACASGTAPEEPRTERGRIVALTPGHRRFRAADPPLSHEETHRCRFPSSI